MNPPPVTAAPTAARSSFYAGIWLKYRQITRNKWLVAVAALLFLAWLGALGYGAHWVYAGDGLQPNDYKLVLFPLWVLWAFLPFFGGGGELDSPRYLDPYPISRPFASASSLANVLTDVQYVILGPVVVAFGYGVGGFVGLGAGILFLVGCVLFGQLGSWLVLASAPKPYKVMVPSGLFLLFAGLLISVFPALSVPNAVVWFIAPEYSAQRLYGLFVMLVPIVLFVVFQPLAINAGLRNRAEQSARLPMLHGITSFPVFSAHMFSFVRSLTFKISLVTSFIIPVVLRLAYPQVAFSQVMMVAVLAVGAAVATNSYSYDHTGVLYLLGAPISKFRLLSARFLSMLAIIVLLLIPTMVLCPILGIEFDTSFGVTAIILGLLIFSATVSGIVLSVKNPAEADHQSLRVRPAPPSSSFFYMFRTGFFAFNIIQISTVGIYALIFSVFMVAVYSAYAFPRAWDLLSDGSSIVASFKT